MDTTLMRCHALSIPLRVDFRQLSLLSVNWAGSFICEKSTA